MILQELISPAVLADASKLANAFATAQPFRHLSIDGFLRPEFADGLLAEFPAFERGEFRSENGRPGSKSTHEQLRAIGTAYARLDDLLQHPEFLAFVAGLTGLDPLRYDPWYLGGGTHENRNGAALDPHIDFNFHPLERWHRRLNLIVYLNPGWQRAWGGSLALYRDPREDQSPSHTVEPVFNRCVIFETNEQSWHGFEPISLPAEHAARTRKSIAVYFYTPATYEDSDPEAHSTVYVPRPLPSHLEAGHALTAQDMQALRQLIGERDERIAMQYEEISRIMTLVRAHERGMSGALMYAARRIGSKLRRLGRR